MFFLREKASAYNLESIDLNVLILLLKIDILFSKDKKPSKLIRSVYML